MKFMLGVPNMIGLATVNVIVSLYPDVELKSSGKSSALPLKPRKIAFSIGLLHQFV